MSRLGRIGAAAGVLLAAACGSGQSAAPPGDPGDGGSSGGASDSGGGSSGASSGSSGASSGSTSSGGSSGSSSGASSSGDGGDASAAYDFSVYQHHKNGTRNGVYVEPTFTKTAVMTMHKTALMGAVTTSVYAQPLYVENGPGGPVFVMATEQNHVMAINATTGALVWDQGPTVFGQPAVMGSLAAGNGNIYPLGITGTPFLDFSSGQGVVYFDAMTTPDGSTMLAHKVYALRLADGTFLPNWPVDISAKLTTFNSRGQNQRGALQLVNGVLYVPYGGHSGDHDTYYGWVVGIPTATPQSPVGWHTTALKGGIWGSGSLPTDGTSVFPVTGNTTGVAAPNWAGGEAVIRLGAGPTFSGNTADYYAPTNWAAMDGSDADLGGANAVLFDMPGTAKPHLIAQGGKDHNLYLLDRDSLGGVGGELLKQTVSTGEINGAPAVYTTSMGTYVAFHLKSGTGSTCPNGGTGNLIAVKIVAGSSMTATVAWCSTKSTLGSPMVTTTDGTSNAVVWDANGSLWGFDGDTGAVVAGGTNTALTATMQGFNTPIAAHGRIVVGVDGAVEVFTP